jgi:hypothetical protein
MKKYYVLSEKGYTAGSRYFDGDIVEGEPTDHCPQPVHGYYETLAFAEQMKIVRSFTTLKEAKAFQTDEEDRRVEDESYAVTAEYLESRYQY